jgi:Cu(I)/Ag(I) efflux system membrane fusion protein
MKKLPTYLILIGFGAALGAGALKLLTEREDSQHTVQATENEPLYWVAPMDSNYRRDEPGKSPMGMDLVPVFATAQMPGVVEIASQIINSLGVRTTIVERSRLHTVIKTVGYVAFNEDRLIHIHPRVEGWIEKLYVTVAGDPVEREAPLYDLYSPQLVNAQEEFLTALERDNTVLIRAAADRLRALQLTESFITVLKRDRKVRQTVTVTSPQKGVLASLNVRDGFFVSPDTTLMAIGALDEVWVEAQVFESQANAIRVGQHVTMQLGYLPGRRWHGSVDYIYPSLDTQTRTLRVRLRFDNDDGALRPNMFTHVHIHQDGDAPTLHVPTEAVIRTGSEDRVVRALGEGRFQSVVVNIGRITDNRVEILAGLSAGDKIVSSAQFLLDSESSKTADFSRIDNRVAADQTTHRDHNDPADHKQHAADHETLMRRGEAMPKGEPHHD